MVNALSAEAGHHLTSSVPKSKRIMNKIEQKVSEATVNARKSAKSGLKNAGSASKTAGIATVAVLTGITIGAVILPIAAVTAVAVLPPVLIRQAVAAR